MIYIILGINHEVTYLTCQLGLLIERSKNNQSGICMAKGSYIMYVNLIHGVFKGQNGINFHRSSINLL